MANVFFEKKTKTCDISASTSGWGDGNRKRGERRIDRHAYARGNSEESRIPWVRECEVLALAHVRRKITGFDNNRALYGRHCRPTKLSL